MAADAGPRTTNARATVNAFLIKGEAFRFRRISVACCDRSTTYYLNEIINDCAPQLRNNPIMSPPYW